MLLLPYPKLRAEEPKNIFTEGLSAAGLKLEDFKWDAGRLARIDDGDPFRLYWYNELWANPIRIPRIAAQMSDRVSIWSMTEGNEINIYFYYGALKTNGYIAAFFNDMLPPLPIKEINPCISITVARSFASLRCDLPSYLPLVVKPASEDVSLLASMLR